MSSFSIPVVDLQQFTSGDLSKKMQFVADLGRAFEQTGFVSVKNHGVSEELISRYYTSIQQFFALPESIKRTYELPELAGQRGYTSFGREHAKGSDAPDLKEFWQMGQITDNQPELKAIYPDNVSVGEVTDFDELSKNLFVSFEKCGLSLLQAIGIHLEIGEFYFDPWVYQGNSILRAIHYPAITQEPKSAIRAEQHEDINLITLLVGASAEGLQLLSKENEWIPITAPEGCLVVNVGDMLQRLTNNRLRSTTHRVVNPPREKWHTPRYSIPFFTHPKSEMPLDCLNSCVSERTPRAYDPITAGDYLNQRLVEIGLKK